MPNQAWDSLEIAIHMVSCIKLCGPAIRTEEGGSNFYVTSCRNKIAPHNEALRLYDLASQEIIVGNYDRFMAITEELKKLGH